MSRYSRLLAKIIAESGYTSKEIVEKCNELGNGIDTTRLSKLQSGKLPAPSEKVSRDIARVCNADERKLVIEGYLEKAPKEIIDTFIILKTNTILAGLQIFENIVTQEQFNLIKNELENEPLADYIVELLDSKDDIVDISSDGFDINSNDFKFRIEEPIALPINDNAMFPIIPKNSKISLKLQNEYANGDILALKVKQQENTLVRYVLFNDNNIILTPLNKEFEQLIYKIDDVQILGKVAKVITEI